MQDWKIPLYKIYWDESDVDEVVDSIKRGSFWAIGPKIPMFEKMVADYVDTKYAVSFNSGTSALHAMMLAYDIGKGDEVIVPSFTFIATANCALYTGAKPVFAEVEANTYGLDPNDVNNRITRKTRAIMPIHYGGLACFIKELREIVDDHNLLLLEDAAESIGASVDGKRVGSFGEAAMISFCGNKVITTGECGIVVTDSKDIYEKLKLIRNHGRLETENYFSSAEVMDYVVLGYNWRISDITAALGISQMKKVDRVIEMRRKVASYITEKLSAIKELSLPVSPLGYHHVYQMYTIRVDAGKERRDALRNYLLEKGIMNRIYFDPVHLTYFYRKTFGFKGGELPITEDLANKVLSIPIYPSMTKDEADYVTKSIEDFFAQGD